MMTEAALAVLKKRHGHLSRTQSYSACLQNHFRGVFPAGRRQLQTDQRGPSDASHPTMNIAVAAFMDSIQNPCCQGSAEVTMQRRHGVRRNVSLKTGTHHE